MAFQTDNEWLPAAAFADAFGITERSARRILSRALDGKPWRGRPLSVRRVPSRGGASGWAFEVHESSLPGGANLPAVIPSPAVPRSPASSPPGKHRAANPASAVPISPPARDLMSSRLRIIRTALQYPAGSRERGRAVSEAANSAGVAKCTIYDWLNAYDAGGMGALGRKQRRDRGANKYHVSKVWDAAVPFGDDDKARIAKDLERYVRSLWAANTEYGASWVKRLAQVELEKLTDAAGFKGDARELRSICRLSRRFVERWRTWRHVAIHDQDAKQFADNQPRIRRTREGRLPMELVVCDVHPMDVLLPRIEGGTFTAKLVAFQDWATNRMFIHPVFLPKGEGVRQEHVAEAIIAMTQDPAWGVPQALYLDNGGEYGCMEMVAAALHLTTEVRALNDDAAFRSDLLSRRRAIIKAQPYNASAKAIEGLFSVLERGVFSMMPGWIGGDRMTKKTANVGREPVPYPHGPEAFIKDLDNCIAAYETHPQSGALAGKSPRDAFRAAVEAGWKRMDVEPGTLYAAFAKDDRRTVRQGGFSYGGRFYTAPEIQALPPGTDIHLRIPICGGLDKIPVRNEAGGLLCVATLDRPYDVLDPEGAKESGRRKTRARAGVKKMRADTDEIDLRETVARLAASEPDAPLAESAGVIQLDDAMDAVGRAMASRTPDERREAEARDEEFSRREKRNQTSALFLEKTRAQG